MIRDIDRSVRIVACAKSTVDLGLLANIVARGHPVESLG